MLARLLEKLWNITVRMISTIAGALETVFKGLESVHKEVETSDRFHTIHTK